MALTFSQIGKAPRVDRNVHGLTWHHVNMNTSLGATGADYSSGFDLRGNAQKLGFRSIFIVAEASADNGSGTALTIQYVWDNIAGKLRVFSITGATEGTVGVVPAGSNIQMLIVGV